MAGSLRGWLEGPGIVDPSQREAFRLEGLEASVGRIRLILPLMVVVHLLHLPAFWPGADEVLEPTVRLWRESITAVHVVSALVGAAVSALTWLLPASRQRWLVPGVGLLYLLHGAVVAGVDQLHHPTVAPYLAYAGVIGVVLVMGPLEAALMYLVGVIALETALVVAQPDPEILRSMIFNGPSITIALVVFVAYLHRTRVRDFLQRRTIDAQAARLREVNEELERRVDAQVAEILQGAEQIEQLNTHLRSRVRDRSRELARALHQIGFDPPKDAQIGQRIDGRYEIVGTLGSGGMGTVYEALDIETGEEVAVKTIHTGRQVSLPMLRRFLREAEAVAALDHPAVVAMLAIDVDAEGTVYQVQELARGVSLEQVSRRVGPMDDALVAAILWVLAEALAHAHAAGVVHRDVKPANLILTPEAPGLRLLDFGIARVREAFVEDATDERSTDELPTDLGEVVAPRGPLTRTGVVMGTPGYMAPEQRLGAELTGPATDIYAVGAVGVALSTGKRPALYDPEEALTCSEPLAALLRSCLSEETADRPDARRLAEQLGPLATVSLQDWVRQHVVVTTSGETWHREEEPPG